MHRCSDEKNWETIVAAGGPVSVTRLGEISLLWHKFKSFGQILLFSFVFGNIFLLLCQKCDSIGQVFIGAEGQIF